MLGRILSLASHAQSTPTTLDLLYCCTRAELERSAKHIEVMESEPAEKSAPGCWPTYHYLCLLSSLEAPAAVLGFHVSSLARRLQIHAPSEEFPMGDRFAVKFTPLDVLQIPMTTPQAGYLVVHGSCPRPSPGFLDSLAYQRHCTPHSRGVKVKSGVSAVSSSGNLIGLCHFNSIFEFDSGDQFAKVIETA